MICHNRLYGAFLRFKLQAKLIFESCEEAWSWVLSSWRRCGAIRSAPCRSARLWSPFQREIVIAREPRFIDNHSSLSLRHPRKHFRKNVHVDVVAFKSAWPRQANPEAAWPRAACWRSTRLRSAWRRTTRWWRRSGWFQLRPAFRDHERVHRNFLLFAANLELETFDKQSLHQQLYLSRAFLTW